MFGTPLFFIKYQKMCVFSWKACFLKISWQKEDSSITGGPRKWEKRLFFSKNQNKKVRFWKCTKKGLTTGFSYFFVMILDHVSNFGDKSDFLNFAKRRSTIFLWKSWKNMCFHEIWCISWSANLKTIKISNKPDILGEKTNIFGSKSVFSLKYDGFLQA